MERLFIYIIDFLIIFIMFLVGCSLILKIYAVIRGEKFKVTDKILIVVPVTLYSVFADFFCFQPAAFPERPFLWDLLVFQKPAVHSYNSGTDLFAGNFILYFCDSFQSKKRAQPKNRLIPYKI